ncbi:MAG: ABC transporter ATP-binding protein, partial [Oscillospiraceae bacterium]|nr:ABC transporter ATP-binding protein [Oscillospiraceae bacterium]
MMSNILEVKNLKKYFQVPGGKSLKAVDDVSFTIKEGETLGIVGESGCGKTTCGRSCIGLYKPTAGQVLYRGQDVHSMRGKERHDFTRKVQMIFQDPYACLDPRMKVESIIAEGLRIQKMCSSKQEEQERVRELLALVGLNREHGNRYIHEFSGGQRQRIGIARALALEPEFILCDEPIASLDVSIQAQIVNLLDELQEQKKLTYLFISHDLSMVKYISDHVGVMYLGAMVEYTSADALYSNPAHP